jgi:hypothetical protein
MGAFSFFRKRRRALWSAAYVLGTAESASTVRFSEWSARKGGTAGDRGDEIVFETHQRICNHRLSGDFEK